MDGKLGSLWIAKEGGHNPGQARQLGGGERVMVQDRGTNKALAVWVPSVKNCVC